LSILNGTLSTVLNRLEKIVGERIARKWGNHYICNPNSVGSRQSPVLSRGCRLATEDWKRLHSSMDTCLPAGRE